MLQRKLIKVGNSQALTLSRDMKEHLGIDEVVEVCFQPDGILLRRPTSVKEAVEQTDRQYKNALRRMAE